MTLPNQQLLGGPAGFGVPLGTPAAGGVASATPAQAPSEDWKTKYDEMTAQLEEIKQNAERDIRGTKSSLQSQIAERDRQFDEERRQWNEKLVGLETKDLDEIGQAKYNATHYRTQAEQASQQIAQMRAELEQAGKVPQYIQLFTDLGISPKQLVVDQGVEELVNSGWRGVVSVIEGLRQAQASAATTPAPAAPAPGLPHLQAPAIASQTSAASTMGSTWSDVLKAVEASVGRPVTQEDVYRMIEVGQLSPSIIPGLGQA